MPRCTVCLHVWAPRCACVALCAAYICCAVGLHALVLGCGPACLGACLCACMPWRCVVFLHNWVRPRCVPLCLYAWVLRCVSTSLGAALCAYKPGRCAVCLHT